MSLWCLALCLLAGAPRVSTAAVSCSGIPATLTAGDLQIEPAEPRVGDDVVIQFATTVAVYSLDGFSLDGTSPQFNGETSNPQAAIFHLHAVQEGEAAVSLTITYGTEEQCVDEETGASFFREGPTIASRFAQYRVVVAAAEPTPTATPSPTSSPTPTATAAPDNGGGGCSVDERATTSLLPAAFAAAAILRGRRRRRRILNIES